MEKGQREKSPRMMILKLEQMHMLHRRRSVVGLGEPFMQKFSIKRRNGGRIQRGRDDIAQLEILTEMNVLGCVRESLKEQLHRVFSLGFVTVYFPSCGELKKQ